MLASGRFSISISYLCLIFCARNTKMLGIATVLFLNACIPIPEAKKIPLTAPAWTNADVDADVENTQVAITSLAPRAFSGNIQAPEQCNRIKFLRFKQRSASANAAEADAVLLMIPGFIEGANAFEYIGRQLVYIAKRQYNKNMEVWAIDRRNNCLEDLTGMQAAEMASNARQAQDLLLGYYYNNQSINGKNFAGWLRDQDLPFLSEFGLAMDVQDLHAILTYMIPNQAQRKRKIFMGGHSQGGPLSVLYAGWDFDGHAHTINDTGYSNIAGLFGFDTSVRKLDPNSVSGDIGVMIGTLFGVNLPIIGEFAYQNSLALMRNQTRLLPIPGLSPQMVAMPEGLGMLAYKAPDAESTVLREITPSSDMQFLLNLNYSVDSEDFNKPPFMSDYRMSNEALLATIFDEDFAVLGFVHTSLGHLHGGAVIAKHFPVPDFVKTIPMLKPLLMRLRFDDEAFIGTDAGPLNNLGTGPLYTWANYNEIGDRNDPEYRNMTGDILYTTTAEEMVDITDFSRTLFKGASNLTEWYYSMRRLIDIAAATQSYATKYGLNYMHGSTADAQLPTLDLVAGNSNSRDSVNQIDGIHEILVIPGMEHMDPMMAVANRPNDYPNPVINKLIQFVLDNQH